MASKYHSRSHSNSRSRSREANDRIGSRKERERGLSPGTLPNSIDRQSTCPLLLRVFCSHDNKHHSTNDFIGGQVPSDELQIYTWMDCTLKELMSLVHEVNPDTRSKGTSFSFATVFPYISPIQRGSSSYRIKKIGTTVSGKRGVDDNLTLASQKFQIGDYIDIATTTNTSQRASNSLHSQNKREKEYNKSK